MPPADEAMASKLLLNNQRPLQDYAALICEGKSLYSVCTNNLMQCWEPSTLPMIFMPNNVECSRRTIREGRKSLQCKDVSRCIKKDNQAKLKDGATFQLINGHILIRSNPRDESYPWPVAKGSRRDPSVRGLIVR